MNNGDSIFQHSQRAIGNTVRLAYQDLVVRRKACRSCPGLTNPADCGGGRFDRDQLGPWTLWQGNLNADLVVVGQDWGNDTYFLSNSGRDIAGNPTNKTLRDLLSVAGV